VTATLQRRYQRLLLAYPLAYRHQRGDELLGTLMELSRPEQQWPAPRQAGALLLAGLRMRAGVDQLRSPAQAWFDGARVALVLMLTLQIITRIWLLEITSTDLPTGESVGWRLIGGSAVTVLVAGLALLLLLFAHNRLGVALALLAPLPPLIPPFGHTWDNLYVFQVACWWLPIMVLAAPMLRRPTASRPWRSSLAIPLLVLASTLLPLTGQVFAALIATLAMLAACLVWAAMIDPRPAIALGLLMLTAIPQLVISASALILVVPAFLIVGTAMLTTGALRAHHALRNSRGAEPS
jgi:hypothetical protein